MQTTIFQPRLITRIREGILLSVDTDSKTQTQIQVWVPSEVPKEEIAFHALVAMQCDKVEYSGLDAQKLLVGAMCACSEMTKARLPVVLFYLILEYLTPRKSVV